VFEGSGTPPEIRGLKNVSGIGTVSMGTNGAALANLDVFADAISSVLEAGGNPSAIVMHPRTWRAVIKLKEQTSGNNNPLVQVEQGGVGEAPRLSLYGLSEHLSK
jgi:HK97 family phage major capsid protein